MNWNNWLYADRLGEEEQTIKPHTNADRIRAMSDEELAEYIDSVAESCYNAGAEDLPLSNSNPLSNAYNILEWLQQPAEGECLW